MTRFDKKRYKKKWLKKTNPQKDNKKSLYFLYFVCLSANLFRSNHFIHSVLIYEMTTLYYEKKERKKQSPRTSEFENRY